MTFAGDNGIALRGPRLPRLHRVVAAPILVLLLTGPASAQEPAQNGAIVGEIIVEDFVPTSPIQVVLLSADWSREWNSEVQQRIDSLFAANAAAVNENRSLFRLIAIRARREATAAVVTRMRVALGASFTDMLREASENQTFEFESVPPGDYRVVAVGQNDRVAAVWSGTVTIRGPLPEFVELRAPVQ
jgi:hypothetical protein